MNTMHKLTSFILAALFAVTVALPAHALAAEGFSKDTMKRMGTFVSNFTELKMYNMPDAQKLTDEQYAEFGVRHEWLNNNARFKTGKDSMASIEASHIENAVMRYFGKKFTAHRSVSMGGGSWEIKYDPGTKRYTIPAADGEMTTHARVESVTQNADGTITMRGTLYNAEDTKETFGPFTAKAKPHKWNGKDTWALLSLECPTKKQLEDAPEAQAPDAAPTSGSGDHSALNASAAEVAPKAGVANAICRVVVTGADVSVMETPSPKGKVRFKASAPAEYIAARYTTVCAGSKGDGSVWYELLGMHTWEKEKIAPSLAGRSAKGALLDFPLYISAKSVREIPLREGDAEAVSEMLQRRFADDSEPENAILKIAEALARYVGRTALVAKAQHDNAVVTSVWDSDDDLEEFAHAYYVYTDTFHATYIGDDGGYPLTVYLAERGANIGGIVLGKSTMADVRAIFGEAGSEHALIEEEKDGFTIQKRNLSGGAPIYDSEAPVERRIPFKAVKKLGFDWRSEEGMGESVSIFFDEGGRAVAMNRYTMGWR